MPELSSFFANYNRFSEVAPSVKAKQSKVTDRNDYYPGGMLMPGRSYNQSASKYRYGFNGKENVNEVKGEGNQQDYGMRIYDPRLVRFLSVDPITAKYPFLTPYQFASNRPIDGIDMDGLEYLTYTIVIGLNRKSGSKIMNEGYVWYNANQHNAHGTLGRGVQYEIKYFDEDNKKFVGQYNPFVSRNAGALWGAVMKEYGNYMGATSLYQVDGEGHFTNKYHYDLPAVDAVDQGAYLHDKGYDRLHAKGANSLFGDWGTTPVDEKALNGWNDFLANSKVGSADPFNNQPVTQTERNAAWQGAFLFKNVVANKKWEIASFMQKNYKEASQGTNSMRGRSFSKNEVQTNYQLFLNKYMNKDSDGNWSRKAGMWSEDKDHNFSPKKG